MKDKTFIWDTVRKWYNYPPLAEPEIVGSVEGGAYFDFRTREIKVGDAYLSSVSKSSGLPKEKCLEGILTHEIGHYMVFPRNLCTIMLCGKFINTMFDSYERSISQEKSSDKKDEVIVVPETSLKEFIFQTYADMCTDTASVLDPLKCDPIINMRGAGQKEKHDELNDNIRGVMLAYLHKQAKVPFELAEELQPFLERMMSVSFLDPDSNRPSFEPMSLRVNLFTYGDIIRDMVDKFKGSSPCSLGFFPIDMGIKKILGGSSREDLREALREAASKISRDEFKDLREWLKDLGVNLHDHDHNGQVGIGTSRGELQIDEEVMRYYKELSHQYPLIVSKKPVDSTKEKKFFQGTNKWRVGKEPLRALPYLSRGMFLPGITRHMRVVEKKIKTFEYDLPHLLVGIDSSGSMPHPATHKSFGVLAGVCAARSYHVHESAVGVVNFSGESFFVPYTRDLDQALGGICAYQGGGTTVNVDMLKKMLGHEEFKLFEEHPDAYLHRIPREAIEKKVLLSQGVFKRALESGNIDLVLITDGGISNLKEILDFMRDTQVLNRGSIILSGSYKEFDPDISDEVIRVHQVDNPEDIPHVVLGDVRKNLNYHAAQYETG